MAQYYRTLSFQNPLMSRKFDADLRNVLQLRFWCETGGDNSEMYVQGLCEVEQHLLPKRSKSILACTIVVPSTVNKEQLGEEPELCNRVVRGASSLKAFFPCNADTDVSFLDHGYVVGAIYHNWELVLLLQGRQLRCKRSGNRNVHFALENVL